MPEHDIASLPATDLRDGSVVHVVYDSDRRQVVFYEITQGRHFSDSGEEFPEIRRKLFALSFETYLFWMGVPEFVRDAIDFDRLKHGAIAHVFYDADTWKEQQ